MRGKKCIKFLTFFITLVLSFVLFSKNTSAISNIVNYNITSIDFRNLNTSTTITNVTPLGANDSGVFDLSGSITNRYGLRYGSLVLHLPSNAKFSNSRRFSFDIYVRSYDDLGKYSLHQVYCPVGTNSEFVIDSCSIDHLDVFEDLNSISSYSGNTQSSDWSVVGNNNNYYIIRIIGYYNSDSDYLTKDISLPGKFFQALELAGLNAGNIKVYLGFSVFKTYIPDESPEEQMNQKDEEDRTNIESQSSDTDSSAESSSEDAENTGTTLLGAFSAFVTALTNASPSNCNLDMDLGNLDLGVVNLCQLSPPQPIPTIASIFLILFCVPLSIATAKKVINLFRSFQ